MEVGSNWKVISSVEQCRQAISSAPPTQLIVVYFYAPTCPHCLKMTPQVKTMSRSFPLADFLYVDVHQTRELVDQHKLIYTPTFLLYKSSKIIDRIDGAEENRLEAAIRKWYKSEKAGSDGAPPRPGNLGKFVDKGAVKLHSGYGAVALSSGLLNQQTLPPLISRVVTDGTHSCLIHVPFLTEVRLNSLVIRAPSDAGPRTLHVYVNRPWNAAGDVDPGKADEVLNVATADLQRGPVVCDFKVINQSAVQSLTIKVLGDKSGRCVTQLDHLSFLGFELEMAEEEDMEEDMEEQTTGEPPLLPALLAKDKDKKCIVIDLDATLVHSSFVPVNNPDFIIPVEIRGTVHQVYVLKRPHVDLFLKRMGEMFECILFTASLGKYADPITDLLDKWNVFRSRLYRKSCVFHRGNYVKDLSRLGRDLKHVIIIDNSPASYLFHPQNAVPILTWFDDPNDNELLDLIPLFERLASAGPTQDVYSFLVDANLGT